MRFWPAYHTISKKSLSLHYPRKFLVSGYLALALFVAGLNISGFIASAADANCQTFSETGFEVCGRFLAYWQQNGGLAQEGYPISAEFDEQQPPPPAGDGLVHRVQYFQRARFEYHSEKALPYDVLLGLLGTEQYTARYKAQPPALPKPGLDDCQYFAETNFRACGPFLAYWQQHGGLAQQGFPISDEFEEQNAPPPAGDGKTHKVQYFQRARFEAHPENAAPYDVLLGLLGAEQYKTRYGSNPPPAITTLASLAPALGHLDQEVSEFRLKDDWDGLSNLAPELAHFYLQRQGDHFEGEAVFSFAGRSAVSDFGTSRRETTRKLNIPLDQAQKFLRLLSQTPVQAGTYQPKIEHTDDYPSLRIEVETGAGPLQLYSASQGQDHIPWGATFAGKNFVINSDTPARALDILRPYLEYTAQKELAEKIQNSKLPPPPVLAAPGLHPLQPSRLQNSFSHLAAPGHTSEVYGLAYSSDGQRFATGGGLGDETIRLWEASGQLLRIIPVNHREVVALAFSPDGKTLASGSADGTIQLWDAATGQFLPVNFNPPAGQPKSFEGIEALYFTLDGQRLISGEGIFGRQIIIWEVKTGQVRATYEGSSVALSSDGATLALLSRGGEGLTLLNLASSQQKTILKEHKDLDGPLAFSPDGKTLTVGLRSDYKQKNTPILLADAATGQVRQTLRSPDTFLFSLAFSPDSKILASASFLAHETNLWEVATGQLQTSLKLAEEARFGYHMAFSPDGKLLLTGGDAIIGWQLSQSTPGQTAFKLEENRARVQALAISPDGQTLASATEGGEVKLWSATDGHLLTTLKGYDTSFPFPLPVTSVAISPDGKYLAAASGEARLGASMIKVWNLESRQELVTIRGHSELVWSLAFSPDSKSLFSASSDRTVRQWELSSGKRLAIFKGLVPEFYEFFTVAVSPDGQSLAAAGGGDNETGQYPIKVWDIKSGREIASLKGHNLAVRTLSFSPDGKLLASAGLDQTIRLWDYHTGQALLNLQVDTKTVNGETPSYERSAYDFNYGANTGTSSLGFSPDGQELASAHPAGYLRLWNPASGEEISTTPAQDSTGSFFVIFAPDGQKLFSGHYNDTTLKNWLVKS